MPSIAIVTDSTACLPPSAAAARGVRVVPLQVSIGTASYTEGVDLTASDIADALSRDQPASTSRPSVETFARTYAEAAADGADEIVSVHLSAEMSGTYEAAVAAAANAPVPVHCVDTRQVGIATGYAVLTAADRRDEGGSGPEVAAAARERGRSATALFYVDTLEYLRRGGRIGAASALVGSALAVKPLLTVRDGRVESLEKVRTSSRALARLADLAGETFAACPHGADLAVQHLADDTRAAAMADTLRTRLGLDDVPVSDVGAVIGVHVGPGMLAVTVAGRPQ